MQVKDVFTIWYPSEEILEFQRYHWHLLEIPDNGNRHHLAWEVLLPQKANEETKKHCSSKEKLLKKYKKKKRKQKKRRRKKKKKTLGALKAKNYETYCVVATEHGVRADDGGRRRWSRGRIIKEILEEFVEGRRRWKRSASRRRHLFFSAGGGSSSSIMMIFFTPREVHKVTEGRQALDEGVVQRAQEREQRGACHRCFHEIHHPQPHRQKHKEKDWDHHHTPRKTNHHDVGKLVEGKKARRRRRRNKKKRWLLLLIPFQARQSKTPTLWEAADRECTTSSTPRTVVLPYRALLLSRAATFPWTPPPQWMHLLSLSLSLRVSLSLSSVSDSPVVPRRDSSFPLAAFGISIPRMTDLITDTKETRIVRPISWRTQRRWRLCGSYGECIRPPIEASLSHANRGNPCPREMETTVRVYQQQFVSFLQGISQSWSFVSFAKSLILLTVNAISSIVGKTMKLFFQQMHQSAFLHKLQN